MIFRFDGYAIFRFFYVKSIRMSIFFRYEIRLTNDFSISMIFNFQRFSIRNSIFIISFASRFVNDIDVRNRNSEIGRPYFRLLNTRKVKIKPGFYEKFTKSRKYFKVVLTYSYLTENKSVQWL